MREKEREEVEDEGGIPAALLDSEDMVASVKRVMRSWRAVARLGLEVVMMEEFWKGRESSEWWGLALAVKACPWFAVLECNCERGV